MLRVENLAVNYGMINAVRGVNFEVNQGEIVSLIGANGAGKSTILRTISGLIKPASGTLTYEGQNITKTNAQKIVQLGISHVPEGRHVFKGLSAKTWKWVPSYARTAPISKKIFKQFMTASQSWASVRSRMLPPYQVGSNRC